VHVPNKSVKERKKEGKKKKKKTTEHGRETDSKANRGRTTQVPVECNQGVVRLLHR
jgi:hypothetical protein